MPSIKIQRLQELIRQKVAWVLTRDMADPRIRMVTVTRVELTRDLSIARVYWSTLEEGGGRRAIQRGLDDCLGFMQREVAGILRTRTTPRLEWRFDPSIEGSERLARILREARAQDEQSARLRGEHTTAPDDDAGHHPAADGPRPD